MVRASDCENAESWVQFPLSHENFFLSLNLCGLKRYIYCRFHFT